MRIRIKGLDDHGPGDVIGAIAGETAASVDKIGNVEVEDNTAHVTVTEETGRLILDELDCVGSTAVTVYNADEPGYFHRLEELVEKERQAEMREHRRSIRNLSGEEREDAGKALLHMQGKDAGKALEGYKIKYSRGEQLPDTQFSVGDLAMISKQDPLRDDNPTGTVIAKTNYSVTLAFDSRPPSFAYGNGVRVDLYVNDVTYQRMLDAIDAVQEHNCAEPIRDALLERNCPEQVTVEGWNVVNERLNDGQRWAVSNSIGSTMHCVHGPPGTGKTTTLIEVIRQSVNRGERVLVTAASNTAVDTILEFLVEHGVRAVRVGHPARVTSTLHEHTLDKQVEDTQGYVKAMELRERAFEVRDEQDGLTYPSGRYRRGMSDAKIHELARKDQGARGVSAETIQEMSEWLELQEEQEELFEEADRLRDAAIQSVLDEHEVVCTTNSTAGSELLQGEVFDTVVIDEATQATEPSCLIPIVHGERVIMAGDHKQLPPTVKEAEELRTTLFERLVDVFDMKTTLRRQYRMHEDIMEFSNQHFYDGLLEADSSVANHSLDDLGVEPVFDTPVVFVDTEGELRERQRPGSTSRENEGEVQIVKNVFEAHREAGVSTEDICVISPYEDQADLLKDLACEVDTVDGFQGREKEVVIVSFVRSNTAGDIGFLRDYRRLNVALTRAKRQLVLIGDASTLTEDNFYNDLLQYVHAHGHVRSVDSLTLHR